MQQKQRADKNENKKGLGESQCCIFTLVFSYHFFYRVSLRNRDPQPRFYFLLQFGVLTPRPQIMRFQSSKEMFFY